MSRRRRVVKRRRQQQAAALAFDAPETSPLRMLRLVPPRPREVPAREVADAPVVEGLASGPFPAPRRSLVAYYLMVSVTVGLIVLAVLRWLDTPPAPILIPTGF